MERVTQEVATKNRALDSLSQMSPNVFYFQTAGTSNIFDVAREKYRQSLSGTVPDDLIPDDKKRKWTSREWLKVSVLMLVVLVIFYLLLKYKFITI